MDWSKADLDTVREIIREAEGYLQSQLSLALAADQRASTMASLFTAAGAAIVAGLIGLAASEHHDGQAPLYVGGIVATGLFIVAASLCIWSTWPVSFAVPGNEPESWYEDIGGPREFKLLLGEQAENYQKKIARNNETLRLNARRFALGALFGIASAPAGFVTWKVADVLSALPGWS
jgi:hypothetical protein